jgi:hypothetical protein
VAATQGADVKEKTPEPIGTPATTEEIAQARRLYCGGSDDNIEVDDNAQASRADEGTWVQAWVWLPHREP